MQFRRALVPVIRLCQYSGLCPISLLGSSGNATVESNKNRFIAITAAILAVQLFLCIDSLVHTDFYIYWKLSNILNYVTLVVSLTIRLHAATALIESFVNRSIQWRLLEKYDEIEAICVDKLRTTIDVDRLRHRCSYYLIIWAIKVGSFVSIVVLCALLTYNWKAIYVVAVSIASLFTSTLFYTQLLVHLDIVKCGMEMINGRLAKLNSQPRLYWRRLHQRPVPLMDTSYICQHLIHLRLCYCKIWEASMLINRYVRWSLMLGINNDFVFFVMNLYWILYYIVFLSSETWTKLIIYTLWGTLNMSHFAQISTVCNEIMEQVSSSSYCVKNGRTSNGFQFIFKRISVEANAFLAAPNSSRCQGNSAQKSGKSLQI